MNIDVEPHGDHYHLSCPECAWRSLYLADTGKFPTVEMLVEFSAHFGSAHFLAAVAVARSEMAGLN